MYVAHVVYVWHLEGSLAQCTNMAREKAHKLVHLMNSMGCRGGRGLRPVASSAVGEGGGFLGDLSQELHGFDPQGQAFAVFALVHVEAG